MKNPRLILLIVAMLTTVIYSCSDDNSPGGSSNNNGGGANTGGCAGGPTTVTDIDGNVYNVVSIGNQCWMKENLKTTRYKNGNPIPSGLSDAQWQANTSGAYSVYKDSAQNDSVYGKLYNWYAVADTNGLCPIGWHMPNIAEWDTLINYLGGVSIAGGAMKETGLTNWSTPNIGATDSSRFTGLPGGFRDNNGDYLLLGNLGQWWSSLQFSTFGSCSRYLYFNSNDISQDFNNKNYGFSVRCVRD